MSGEEVSEFIEPSGVEGNESNNSKWKQYFGKAAYVVGVIAIILLIVILFLKYRSPSVYEDKVLMRIPEYRVLSVTLKQNEKDLAALKKQHEELLAEQKKVMDAKVELQIKFNKVSTENVTLTQERTNILKQLSDLQKTYDDANAALSALKAKETLLLKQIAELEKTNLSISEQLASVQASYSASQARVAELEKQYADKLAEYNDLRKNFDESGISLGRLQQQYADLEALHAALKKTQQAASEAHLQELSAKDGEIKALTIRVNELLGIKAQLEKSVEEALADKSALDANALALAATIAELEALKVNLLAAKERDMAEIERLKSEMTQRNKEYDDLALERDELLKDLASKNDDIKSLQAVNAELTATIAALQQAAGDSEGNYSTLMSEKAALQQLYDTTLLDLKASQEAHGALQTKYDELVTAHDILKKEKESSELGLNETIATLESTLASVRANHDAIAAELLTVKASEEALKQSLADMTKQFEETKAKLTTCEADLASARSDLVIAQTEVSRIAGLEADLADAQKLLDINILKVSEQATRIAELEAAVAAQSEVNNPTIDQLREYILNHIKAVNDLTYAQGNIPQATIDKIRNLRDVISSVSGQMASCDEMLSPVVQQAVSEMRANVDMMSSIVCSTAPDDVAARNEMLQAMRNDFLIRRTNIYGDYEETELTPEEYLNYVSLPGVDSNFIRDESKVASGIVFKETMSDGYTRYTYDLPGTSIRAHAYKKVYSDGSVGYKNMDFSRQSITTLEEPAFGEMQAEMETLALAVEGLMLQLAQGFCDGSRFDMTKFEASMNNMVAAFCANSEWKDHVMAIMEHYAARAAAHIYKVPEPFNRYDKYSGQLGSPEGVEVAIASEYECAKYCDENPDCFGFQFAQTEGGYQCQIAQMSEGDMELCNQPGTAYIMTGMPTAYVC